MVKRIEGKDDEDAEWQEFELQPNEKIIGINGKTFDDKSAKKLKSFGFILLQK